MMEGGTRLQESEVLGSKLKLTSLLSFIFILVLSFPPSTSPAAILQKRSDVTELPPESSENSIFHESPIQDHTTESTGVDSNYNTTTAKPLNELNPVQQITTPPIGNITNGQQPSSSVPHAPVLNTTSAVPSPTSVPSATTGPSNTSESDMLDCFCPIEIITEIAEDRPEETVYQEAKQNQALGRLLAMTSLNAKDLQRLQRQRSRKPIVLAAGTGRRRKMYKGDLPRIDITEKQLRELLRRGLKFTYSGQSRNKSQENLPRGRAVLGIASQGESVSIEDELDTLLGRKARYGRIKMLANKGVRKLQFQSMYTVGRGVAHGSHLESRIRNEDESEQGGSRPSGRGLVFSQLKPQDIQQMRKRKFNGNIPQSFARLDEDGTGRYGGSHSTRTLGGHYRHFYEDYDERNRDYSDSKAESVEPPPREEWIHRNPPNSVENSNEENSYNRRKKLRNQRPRQRRPQKGRDRKDENQETDYSGQSESSEHQSKGRKNNRNNLGGKGRSESGEENSPEDAPSKSKASGIQKSRNQSKNSPADYDSQETQKGSSGENQDYSHEKGASRARRPYQRRVKNAHKSSGENTKEELESHEENGKEETKRKKNGRFSHNKRRLSQKKRKYTNAGNSGEDEEENGTASRSKQKHGKAKKLRQKSLRRTRKRGKQENRKGKYRKKKICNPKTHKCSQAAVKARPRPSHNPQNVKDVTTEPVDAATDEQTDVDQSSRHKADFEETTEQPPPDDEKNNAQEPSEQPADEENNGQQPAEQTTEDENGEQEPAEQTADEETVAQRPAGQATEEEGNTQQTPEQATNEDSSEQTTTERAVNEENGVEQTTEKVEDEDKEQTTETAEDKDNIEQTTAKAEDEENHGEQTTEKADDEDNNVQHTTEKGDDENKNAQQTTEKTGVEANTENNLDQPSPQSSRVPTTEANAEQPTETPTKVANYEVSNAQQPTEAPVEAQSPSPEAPANGDQSNQPEPANNAAAEEVDPPKEGAPATEEATPAALVTEDIQSDDAVEDGDRAGGEGDAEGKDKREDEDGDDNEDKSEQKRDKEEEKDSEESGNDDDSHENKESSKESTDSEETKKKAEGSDKQNDHEPAAAGPAIKMMPKKNIPKAGPTKMSAQQPPRAPAKQPSRQAAPARANQPKPVSPSNKIASAGPGSSTTSPNNQKTKIAGVQPSQRIPTRPKVKEVPALTANEPAKPTKQIAEPQSRPKPGPNPVSKESDDESSHEEQGTAELETKTTARGCEATQKGKSRGRKKGNRGCPNTKKKQQGKRRKNNSKKGSRKNGKKKNKAKKGKKNKKGKKTKKKQKKKKPHDDPSVADNDSDGNGTSNPESAEVIHKSNPVKGRNADAGFKTGTANNIDSAEALGDSPMKTESKSQADDKKNKKQGQKKQKKSSNEARKKASKEDSEESGKKSKKEKETKNKKKSKKAKKKKTKKGKKKKDSDRTKRLADEPPSPMKPKKVCICFRRNENPSPAVSAKPQNQQRLNRRPQKTASYVKIGDKQMKAPFTLHVTRKNRPSVKLEFKSMVAL